MAGDGKQHRGYLLHSYIDAVSELRDLLLSIDESDYNSRQEALDYISNWEVRFYMLLEKGAWYDFSVLKFFENRRKKQIQKRISGGIRSRIADKISLGNRNGKSVSKFIKKNLGYSIKQLMDHLESKFDGNMSWDNYGSYWHIDHIRPESWFEYTSLDDQELKKCWALENLQPLEAKENIRKGNRYEG